MAKTARLRILCAACGACCSSPSHLTLSWQRESPIRSESFVIAFSHVVNDEDSVFQDPKFVRPPEDFGLVGDTTKAE